jgi:hypothetical protein
LTSSAGAVDGNTANSPRQSNGYRRVRYRNDKFYDPLRGEHRRVSFVDFDHAAQRSTVGLLVKT